MTTDLERAERGADDGTTFPSPTTNIAPSAFGGDLKRLWSLTFTLATTEFRLRYLGSVLGYVWSLLRPLLFFGVIYVVFTQIFKASSGPHYGVYMLSNIILWTFFLEVTGASIQCLVAREGLLRKMRFPRLAIPLSVCLTSAFTLAMNLVVVVIFAVANGVYPRWTWLEMPVIVALWGVLALGVGMTLSVLYVRMHDIQPIWDVVSQILFYGSPLIYALSKYPAGARTYLLINPIAALATQTAHAFVDPSYQSLATAMGGTVHLLEPLAVIVAVAGCGLWLFVSRAPLIAENL
jgi:ABC-2 type transport system permease protein